MIARLVSILTALSLVAAASAPQPDRAGAPIAAGYQPQDKDERGLWMQLDEVERLLKTSDFLIRDPALNAYVRGVLCRMIGDAQCRDVRLYIVRTAAFNASMAPNGLMIVNTGLLLRIQDEAQLAAILGHEFTHFSRQHSPARFPVDEIADECTGMALDRAGWQLQRGGDAVGAAHRGRWRNLQFLARDGDRGGCGIGAADDRGGL